MTTSVRICLSYDHFKFDFVAFEVDNCSTENAWLTWTSSWRFLFLPKCYITCSHTIFMTWCYPLINSNVIWYRHVWIPPWEKISYRLIYRSSIKAAQSDQGRCFCLIYSAVSNDSISRQLRPRSDCALIWAFTVHICSKGTFPCITAHISEA